MASETACMARAILEERKNIAQWLMNQRINCPSDETEEYINAAISVLAWRIKRGEHLR